MLADGARNTFGNVDMKWYSYILQKHGCADVPACQQEIGSRIHSWTRRLQSDYLAVLGSSDVGLRFTADRRDQSFDDPAPLSCCCFASYSWLGGVLTPMIEVEAKISRLGLTFMGEPIAFHRPGALLSE